MDTKISHFIIQLLCLSFISTKPLKTKKSPTSDFEAVTIDNTRFNNAKIFDLDSSDPYLGVTVDSGYLPFPSSDKYKEKLQYYLYIQNSKLLPPDQMPQIITNPGGPCWSSLIELFIGIGPYNFNVDTLKLSKNKWSTEPFADTLFMELPMGAGFSKSDPYIVNYEDNTFDWMTSQELYSKKFPEKLNKKRPIYQYMSSYAGLDLIYAINVMMDNGWNVKGFIDDGPVGNMGLWAVNSMENLYMYGNISWFRYQYFKFLTHFGNFLYDFAIFGNRGLGFLMQILPIVGFDTKLLASVNDVRPQNPYKHVKLVKSGIALVKTENFRKAFNGKTTCTLINFDCQLKVFFNTPLDSTKEWQKVLERGVKAVLVEGKYDFPFGIKTVMIWLKELEFSKKGFNDEKWQKSEFGKKKSWKNLWLEVVDNSGHTTALDQPQVIYKRMKQMIEGDIF